MNNQSGQVLIISVIFLTVMLVLMGALLGFVGQNVLATRRAVAGEQALQLADAGAERAIWQLNETGGSYSGETNSVLGGGVFDVSVANISGSVKEITATGYVPDKIAPRAARKVKVQVSIDITVVSFNFGVQVGAGGIEMENNARVNGSVYSNGPIDGGTQGSRITGSAFSAGAAGLIQDMSVDGNASAHTINRSTVGGSAYGYSFTNGTVGGNVKAYSISSCTVGGSAWYTTKSSCTIGGAQNAPYPGEPDPAALPMPISDEQITDWKQEAQNGGVTSGNYTVSGTVSLGPRKITGNLTVGNGAILNLAGPVWVVGNITVSQGGTVRLDASYGGLSEALLSDGQVELENNSIFSGAGSGSYVMILTTSSSGDAVEVENRANALIIYAANGTVEISNNALLREVTAYRLEIEPNGEVTYESGLANLQFSSGPGGSWAVVRGTWREAK